MRKSMQNLGKTGISVEKSAGNLKNPEKNGKLCDSNDWKNPHLEENVVNCNLQICFFFVYQNDVQLSSEQNLHPDIPKQHQAGKRLGTVKNDTKMASCRGTAA